ncbi:MAG: hypothetical protein JNK32_13480 [Anaerolineales bacterium]|nr:hypothetical protein [Anaerolineales bacterium]
MKKNIFLVLTVLAVFLSACGGQPVEPTLSPEQVQGTAISAAFTMVAETQAAVPTNTPLPPTETPSPTPLPTFTPPPSPTPDFALLPTATVAAASTGGEDNCLHPLNVAEAGPQSNVRFENDSGGTQITLSLNLATNLHGQCGTLVYTLGKNEKLVVSLPKGEYFAYAWIVYKNGDTSTATGFFVNKVGDNHLFPVLIKEHVIVSK